MASEPTVGGNDGASEKQKQPEYKVYTRKSFRGAKKQNNTTATASPTVASTATPTVASTATPTVASTGTPTVTSTATPTVTSTATATVTATAATDVVTTDNTNTAGTVNDNTSISSPTTRAATNVGANDCEKDGNINSDNSKEKEIKNSENNEKGSKNDDERNNTSAQEPSSEAQPPEDTNSAQQLVVSRVETVSDDSSSLNRQQNAAPPMGEPPSENGMVKAGVENRLKINLVSSSKQDLLEFRKKLEGELDTVRVLMKRIEGKEGQLGSGFSNSRVPFSVGVGNGVKRVHSELASVGFQVRHDSISRQSRPLNQLSISVLENSQGVGEIVEKEKRTPKANQFYRNSEFLLAKDKFPPAESNKKSKSNGKKHGGVDAFGPGNKFFRSCSSLLEKLMKHKHGWVFNAPVDVKGLGLHDYFTIIKHPMDLGTVKTRLSKNWYKSPREFAEDVRLTFNNAMIYNPKGQDVHVMAETLSKIFEERWAVIESEYNRETRFGLDFELGFHTPTSRRAPPLPPPPPLDMRRILERSESMSHAVDLMRPRPIITTPLGRTPALKKPKAKDPHKRDMTYEEKQKLSTNLQSLPSEKLDNIVQIIKKRNSSLFQHDDEIEVDIDSVDAETLWELDRFVTNYKKSLSKNKRKAELAIQARAEVEQNLQQQVPGPVATEVPNEVRTVDERNAPSSSPVQVEKLGETRSRSSSSSSSSSDSGSSSSDSDSDTSSSGSEGERSPRT